MLGFLNIGPGEVLVILVIALVVLGPSRLPATARTLGRFLARTRDVAARFQQEMQAAADAPLEIIARERGRLSEPIRTADRARASQPDDPAPEGETAATGGGPDERAGTIGGVGEALDATVEDSESEDRHGQ